MDDIPVFRANKRRKVMRNKNREAAAEHENSGQYFLSNEPSDAEDQEINAVSGLIRPRRQAKSRGSGVRFSREERTENSDGVRESMALTKVDPDEEKLRDMSNRFVGSTGQVVDVDKHMMAYIDSEMAKRHNTTAEEYYQPTTNNRRDNADPRPPMNPPQYRSQLQLSEFDLGQDVHEQNLARTEAAIAQAQSGTPAAPEERKPRKPRKPRLGRDGKPLRPRVRKGRNSEDVARDALVEQILNEHKVAVYEGDPVAGTAEAAAAGAAADSDMHGEHEDADEKLAEQFKQEFLDAMAERRQKRQVKAATTARAKGMGPEQSGPKLGGSRSARAKMVQMRQEAQQKGSTQK